MAVFSGVCTEWQRKIEIFFRQEQMPCLAPILAEKKNRRFAARVCYFSE